MSRLSPALILGGVCLLVVLALMVTAVIVGIVLAKKRKPTPPTPLNVRPPQQPPGPQ